MKCICIALFNVRSFHPPSYMGSSCISIAGLCSWNWGGGSCSDQALRDSRSFVVPVQNCTDAKKHGKFSFLSQHQMLLMQFDFSFCLYWLSHSINTSWVLCRFVVMRKIEILATTKRFIQILYLLTNYKIHSPWPNKILFNNIASVQDIVVLICKGVTHNNHKKKMIWTKEWNFLNTLLLQSAFPLPLKLIIPLHLLCWRG